MVLPNPPHHVNLATVALTLCTLLSPTPSVLSASDPGLLLASESGVPAAPQARVLQSLDPLGGNPHVIIIIVDGLRPDLITAARTPVLQRLVDEGASTLEAKTVRPSATLPSITSMFTGLRPRDHGVTWNDYSPDKGSVTATTIFDVAHQAGVSTAFFSGKVKLRHAVHSESLDAESVRFLPDASVALLARARLEEHQPGLMVVHLPNVDRAGHQYGWRSDEQKRTLIATDLAIASILQVIESGALDGPARVIVTADHGGEGRNHLRQRRGNETVPWLVWGDGVEPRAIDSVSVTLTAAVALRSLGLNIPANMDTGR